MITGGKYKDLIQAKVTSYNANGFLEDLPELKEARISHGCTYYTDTNNKQVIYLNVDDKTKEFDGKNLFYSKYLEA